MGAADAIPGVSGGTIALVLGIYARLVEAVAVVLRAPLLVRSAPGRARLGQALRFALPLFLGIATSLYLGTRLLVGPDDEPGLLRRADTAPLCYAFFSGLVFFSLGEPLRRVGRRTPAGWALAAATTAAAFWFVGLPYATRAPEPWMLVPGGAAAICVMLLPGVSGSLLLVVLGQYATVTGAIHTFDPLVLGLFALGVLLGLSLFVPALKRLLETRRDVTLMALTGLMAGSLRALWPWKSHYDVKDAGLGAMLPVAPSGSWWPVVLSVALGGVTVLALRLLEIRIERASARLG